LELVWPKAGMTIELDAGTAPTSAENGSAENGTFKVSSPNLNVPFSRCMRFRDRQYVKVGERVAARCFLGVPRHGNAIRTTSNLTNPAKHLRRDPTLPAEMNDPIDHGFVGVDPGQLDAVVTIEDNGAASAAYSLPQLLLLPHCLLHEVFRHDGSFLPVGMLLRFPSPKLAT
jgi:hypothetical protein